MWFSLVCLALMLAVALKVGTQGLFGAFITLVLTICCAATAIGMYEWLGVNVLAQYWKPNYALPIAMAALFGIPLLVLRLVFDRLVRRACLLPSMVDRIGAGVFALLTGLIMTGMMAACVQMIPFNNGKFLGFSRIDIVTREKRTDPTAQPPSGEARDRGLLLSPDRFVVGLATVLSDGIFSGQHSLYQHHPDMMQTIGWVGAADAEVSRFAPPRSISVVRTALIPYVYQVTPGNESKNEPAIYEPETPGSGYEYRMVRVRLTAAAMDEKKSHAFTLRQYRLVGTTSDDVPVQFHPMALQQEPDPNDVTNRHIVARKTGRHFWPILDSPFVPHDRGELEIVFKLPKGFKPSFLEYKREARTSVSFADSEKVTETPAPARQPATTPTAPSTASATPSDAPATTPSSRSDRGRRRGGRVRAATATPGGSQFGDDLPVVMRSYQSLKNADVARGVMSDGHLVGEFDAQAGGPNPEVRKFAVPDDKRLLHLHVQGLQAGSTLGRALSQATRTVQNYFVSDDRGRRYELVGKYAIAMVNGTKVVEIQYFSNKAGSIGGLGAFERIDESKLAAQDTFALLFLVEPGARIVSFSTGGSASRQDDLTSQNLTAPQ